MTIAPNIGRGINLQGEFKFKAVVSGQVEFEESFNLEIIVPEEFPKAIPEVREIGKKIPRIADFHVNDDGTLCLGSPLRILGVIYNYPNICDFASKCLVPYLYAVSFKIKYGGDFIFGDLAHGFKGVLADYSLLLGLKEHAQVKQALILLGLKKRIANKRNCPCGCGKKLGACTFHHKLNDLRKMAPISWFNAHAHVD